MSDSVGRIQLDLEINPNSISREMDSVKEAFSSGMKKPFTDMGKFFKSSMARMADGFKSMVPGAKVAKDAEDMSNKFGGSISKMQKYLNSLQDSFDKTQDKISGMNAELMELYHQRDKIMQDIAGSAFPLSGLTRGETIDILIGENAELRKLDVQIGNLEAKMQPWIDKNQRATEEIRQLGTAIENLEQSTAQAGQTTEKAGRQIEKAGQKVQKSKGAFTSAANSIQKAFMRVLKQIFVFALLYKAIRGFMDYVGSALKTNEAFSNSLAQVKTNLQVAFMPIYQAVLPALQTLMHWLAVATTYIATFVSFLFGKTYAASFAAAKGLGAATKALGAHGKAAKKTLGILAGFDEINLLGGPEPEADTGGGAGGVDLMPPPIDVTAFEESLAVMRERFLGFFQELRQMWESETPNMFTPFRVGLENLWHNTLVPMKDFFLYDYFAPIGEAVVSDLVPIFADVIPWAIGETGKWWLWLADVANKIWTDIIEPVYTLIRNIVVDTLGIISDLWDEHGQGILDNLSEFFQNMRDLWDKLWTEILEPIIIPFWEMLQDLWDNHLKDLVKQVGDFIAKLIKGALDLYNGFIAPLVSWVIDFLAPRLKFGFEFVRDVIITVIGIVSDVLKGLIKVLGGVIDFVVGIFTGDWKRAWDGIKNIVTGTWDIIVGAIKGAINLIINAINMMIRGMNLIKFNVPDWIPLIGGKSFGGFNIPQIPTLARGGIIDQPTLAMIGERRKKEAIVPLENTAFVDKMAAAVGSAVLAALQFSGGAGGADDRELIIEIDGAKLARVLLPKTDAELQRRGGRSLLQPV